MSEAPTLAQVLEELRALRESNRALERRFNDLEVTMGIVQARTESGMLEERSEEAGQLVPDDFLLAPTEWKREWVLTPMQRADLLRRWKEYYYEAVPAAQKHYRHEVDRLLEVVKDQFDHLGQMLGRKVPLGEPGDYHTAHIYGGLQKLLLQLIRIEIICSPEHAGGGLNTLRIMNESLRTRPYGPGLREHAELRVEMAKRRQGELKQHPNGGRGGGGGAA